MSPMNEARMNKNLDKYFRDGLTGEIYTQRQRIDSGYYVGRSTSIQEYANKKVNLTYAKLAKPKIHYLLKTKDDVYIETTKLIWDNYADHLEVVE
tara:strand:+ start:434 stop:718 length:285 start_codon:yes stop_codon:yes gene_type:complete